MGVIATISGIVMLVFGILQIILFFKLWGMTNTIGDIKRIMNNRLTMPEGKSEEAEKQPESGTDYLFFAVGLIVVAIIMSIAVYSGN